MEFFFTLLETGFWGSIFQTPKNMVNLYAGGPTFEAAAAQPHEDGIEVIECVRVTG